MENEVRDTIHIAISLILVSMVIGFIVYCASVVSGIGSLRTEEVASNNRVVQYREYNAYDEKTLIGDEVIELIRQKYDDGVTIFVDSRTNKSTHETVDNLSNTTCANCMNRSGDHRKFNQDMYIIHKDLGTDLNYFSIGINTISIERNDMRNWFPTDSKYASILVYNSRDTEDYYTQIIDYYDANNRGASTKEEKLEVLFEGTTPKTAGAEVTGVILINFTTLGIVD